MHPPYNIQMNNGLGGRGGTLKDESIGLDLNNSTTRTERSDCISTSIIQNLNDCMGGNYVKVTNPNNLKAEDNPDINQNERQKRNGRRILAVHVCT